MAEITINEKQYINEEVSRVTVSFQLTFHDWCLLKKMPEWMQIEELIKSFSNE